MPRSAPVTGRFRHWLKTLEVSMPKKPQTQTILEHLKKYKTISPLEALELCHCMRLARVINDLRNQGHPIRTQMLTNTKSGRSHALYVYENEQ
jgi:hypothetical protein